LHIASVYGAHRVTQFAFFTFLQPLFCDPYRFIDNAQDEPIADPLWDLPATIDGPTAARIDGWTPFARKLFLSILADTGRIAVACEYTQRSRQSAYQLRARDPVFANGWDAAAEKARAHLADTLYERAIDGVTETITRDGVVIAERHRHDSRLSIAVLNRLDKRADLAVERGSKHLNLVCNWEAYLELVGKGHDAEAQALLDSGSVESAEHCQLCQLPHSGNPICDCEASTEEEGIDLSDRFWREDDGSWYTNFPPPPDFSDYERGEYHDHNYRRACTPEEEEILEADFQAEVTKARVEDVQLRDEPLCARDPMVRHDQKQDLRAG
jgi:hypothetical protein